MIRPKNQDHPSIVVEAGWPESYPHLERDMRLWLEGTRQVNVVLVIKWSRSSSKVRGIVEAWSRGANGAPTKRVVSVCVSLLVFFEHHIDGCYIRSFSQSALLSLTLSSHVVNYSALLYHRIRTPKTYSH